MSCLSHRSARILAMTVLALCSAGAVHAMEIITPADGGLVSPATRLIVKCGDAPPIDAITIAVNGEKSDLLDISAASYREKFRDFVFLEIGYDQGVNKIEVAGYAAGKRVAAATARVYLPGATEDPPAEFAVKPFHRAEQEARCKGCHHLMEPTAKQLQITIPGQNPCGSCHAALVNHKHVHGPAGVFDCTACHDAQSRPVKYAIADADALCLECHDDKVKEFRAAKFVHGPVEAGLCLLCHDPHASDTPAQIRGELNASCSRCHEDVMKKNDHVVRAIGGGAHPLEGKRNPADPGRPFNCASCHEPHSGENRGMLRGGGTSPMALCRLCHQK